MLNDLHLHLGRHERHAVGGHIAEIGAHIGGRHLDVFHQLLAHFLNELLVLELIVHIGTHLLEGLFPILFQFLLRACDLYPTIDLLVDACRDLALGHLDGVDGGLMEKQLLHSQLLRDDTLGIASPGNTFGKPLHAHGFDVRLQDGLIAHNPYHLIDNTALGGDNLRFRHRIVGC